jgi:DNA-binding transcriptional regulator YiaG
MNEEPRVGVLIARARHRKRLSQRELADLLGVSKSTVANWEVGKHFPLRKAGAIEEALEITIPAPYQVPA